MDNLKDIRKEYDNSMILKWNELPSDPMVQFERWYLDAESAGIEEPNAMALATATPEGKPSVRIVLLKGYGPEGFSFYTNYESRKSAEIDKNPLVALTFWWKELHRQVRIEGIAKKMEKELSRQYFQSRPRDSQVSAWASPQSESISEAAMEERRKEIEEKFKGMDPLPLPSFWGGFIVEPVAMEFWQGRENRYHDRFKFLRKEDSVWAMQRLAP